MRRILERESIVGQVVSKVFEANRGYLNTLLRSLGMGGLCRTWLADSSLALGCLCFVNIWQWTGYSMLLYYAGMLNIGNDIYEAAEIDGASKLRCCVTVVMPVAKPGLAVVLMQTFLSCWNEVLMARIFISDTKVQPCPSSPSALPRPSPAAALPRRSCTRLW